jgi:hypothetical protein
MNRFKRASALGLAVPRPDWRCWAGDGRAAGRLRGVAGASETAPLPFGLSPRPVWPGSFGEVTHSS